MTQELKIMLNDDDFEGPLDLLLHLVQSYKVDIFDVPLLTVIEQYLDFISSMQELNLELAGDYMIMASQLMLIKSRRLLPTVSEDFEEETEQLEQDILEQIVEYQKIKEVSGILDDLHVQRAKHFSKARTEIASPEVKLEHNLGTIDLFLAFSQILAKKEREDRTNHTVVESESFTINEKITVILEIIHKRNRVPFNQLFESSVSRDEMITSFLAVLELVKSKQLKLQQDGNFAIIYLLQYEQ